MGCERRALWRAICGLSPAGYRVTPRVEAPRSSYPSQVIGPTMGYSAVHSEIRLEASNCDILF